MKVVIGLLVLLLGACTWVKPDAGAESVEVKMADDVIGCQYLGSATGNTTDRVVVFRRGAEKVAAEILTLVRNEAVEMSGDTLVAQANVAAGTQTYAVYKCH